jgi:hypothetical protein
MQSSLNKNEGCSNARGTTQFHIES